MLAAILAAGALEIAGPDVGNRIQAASAAEQALQGPLDGAWTLRDARNRRLYALQLVDPVGGGGLGGAWRDQGTGPGRHMGVLADVRASRARLHFRIEGAAGDATRIDLVRGVNGEWRGWLRSGLKVLAVVMKRG